LSLNIAYLVPKDVFLNPDKFLNIQEENSLLLYNPQRDLPIDLEVDPNSWMVSILISIKKFHGLFSQEADYISFLNEDNRDKKYYKDGVISPSMAIVLNQLISFNLNQSIKSLYFKEDSAEFSESAELLLSGVFVVWKIYLLPRSRDRIRRKKPPGAIVMPALSLSISSTG